MKKKIKISLILSLAIIFGCFSNVFAATNQNNKADKISQVSKNARFLQSASTDDGVVGTSNLNGTADNSAKVGDTLPNPEVGWKRYDDTNIGISYNQNTEIGRYTGCYNSTYHIIYFNQSINIKFKGTKIRLIGVNYSANQSANMKLTIDDKIYNYSCANSSGIIWQAVNYEVTGLENTTHTVKLIQNDENGGKHSYIDAIDIDSTGYLIDPSSTLATGITLNKTTDSLILNDSIKGTDTLISTVTPDSATNKTVTWKSSDENVVYVDSVTGKITAKGTGTATITATTADGSNLSASCIVTVSEPAETTTISLNKASDLIDIGGNDILAAEVSPSNIGVTWSSSDDSIVTVDADGKITGIKEGTAIITATTVDGKKVSCTVTVKNQETGKSKLIIYMGNQVTREYYLTEDEINDFINWYDARANDKTPKSYYVFKVPAQGVLPARKDYVLFDKIKAFEVE